MFISWIWMNKSQQMAIIVCWNDSCVKSRISSKYSAPQELKNPSGTSEIHLANIQRINYKKNPNKKRDKKNVQKPI